MVTDKKITITAKTVLEETEIANYGAIVNVEKNEVSFYTRFVDKAACKDNRELVRKDQAEFEDFAYSIQDKMKAN